MTKTTVQHFVCDRCGEHTKTEQVEDTAYGSPRPEGWGRLELTVPGEVPEVKADLCESCKVSFKQWLAGCEPVRQPSSWEGLKP